jgi:hypothetical protein
MEKMNKKVLFILLGIVIVLVWIFYPHKRMNEKITSDDGNVTLTFSKEALPESVQLKDVHIKKLEIDEVPIHPSKENFISSYQFEPDGLIFKKPIEVTFILHNVTDSSIPTVEMVSKGEMSSLTHQKVNIDSASKTTSITGEISHFSYAVLHRSFFAIKVTDPTDHFIGESFDVEGIQSVERRTYVFSEDVSQVTTHTLTDHPLVRGMLSARLPRKSDMSKAVTPDYIIDFPAKETKIPESGELKTVGRFTCVESGEVEFGYIVDINKGGLEWRKRFIPMRSTPNVTYQDEVHQYENNVSVAYSSDSFNCLPQPETATTTQPKIEPVQEKIRVIQYNSKYVPLSELKIENESGCGADHYHAKNGFVIATDGTKMYDPGPQCGYGKVSQKPTLEIPKP